MANFSQTTGGDGGGGAMSFKQTFTAAQLKTSSTNPLLCIAAPGANKVVVIISNTVVFTKQAGVAYNYGTSDSYITYDPFASSSCIPYTIFAACLETNNAVQSLIDSGINFPFGNENNIIINKAIYFGSSANSVVGSGSATLTFKYYILDLS